MVSQTEPRVRGGSFVKHMAGGFFQASNLVTGEARYLLILLSWWIL